MLKTLEEAEQLAHHDAEVDMHDYGITDAAYRPHGPVEEFFRAKDGSILVGFYARYYRIYRADLASKGIQLPKVSTLRALLNNERAA